MIGRHKNILEKIVRLLLYCYLRTYYVIHTELGIHRTRAIITETNVPIQGSDLCLFCPCLSFQSHILPLPSLPSERQPRWPACNCLHMLFSFWKTVSTPVCLVNPNLHTSSPNILIFSARVKSECFLSLLWGQVNPCHSCFCLSSPWTWTIRAQGMYYSCLFL